MRAKDVLREVMRREGVSASDLSRSMGHNRSNISVMLTRNKSMGSATFATILDRLGWDVVIECDNGEEIVVEPKDKGGVGMSNFSNNDSEWQGEGWYRIAYSDGGQDWTNEGPIWIENRVGFDEEMKIASAGATEFHLPYAEYMGDGDEPKEG